MMEIRVNDREEMVNIVCLLVKKGFGFSVHLVGNSGVWVITLTGGF